MADEGAVPVIPVKSNARRSLPHDPNFSAMRNLVEGFFCRMKDMRRHATRSVKLKLKLKFVSMLHGFAIRCWLKRGRALVDALKQRHLRNQAQAAQSATRLSEFSALVAILVVRILKGRTDSVSCEQNGRVGPGFV